MKWEYQSFGLWWTKWQEAIDYLNALGEDGWEAVSLDPKMKMKSDKSAAKMWGVFKRPKAIELTGDID